MTRGLHLVSCYLPNNPFVDTFLAAMARELQHLGQEMVLLPTYSPSSDGLRHVQLSYTLSGYVELFQPASFSANGLLPAALADAESAWMRCETTPAAHTHSVAACTGFLGRLLDKMEPDSVSIWNPAVPQGRLLHLACLARAIPCYAVERGVFAETMMIESREVGAQADVATHPVLRSILMRQPADRDRLAAIRAYYAQRDIARYPTLPVVSAAALKQELGIPRAARSAVLMLSAAAANWLPRSMPGARFTSPWFDSAQQAVDQLIVSLPEDVHLIVQDHPLDHGRWAPLPRDRVHHLRSADLRTLFEVADLLVFLGATTVQHEALLLDKPLLLLSRSQLSGQGVAYEYTGIDLDAVISRALEGDGRQAQQEAIARYVPFLFEHALFGLPGAPTRQSAADLARHLAMLGSPHALDVETRLERWLSAAVGDLPALHSPSPQDQE